MRKPTCALFTFALLALPLSAKNPGILVDGTLYISGQEPQGLDR
jgi:hypothetical protein